MFCFGKNLAIGIKNDTCTMWIKAYAELREGGAKMPFRRFTQDCRNEDLFWRSNIVRAILGDLFVTVTTIMAENDIYLFLRESARIGRSGLRDGGARGR